MEREREKELPNITALAHYYRGEIGRSNTWRNIVDNTTNWAVGITAAMLGFTFGEKGGGSVVLIFAHILLFIFLVIEGRRYKYYVSLDSRVRFLQKQFFGPLIRGVEDLGTGEWREILASDMISWRIKISQWAAMSIRLRRTYIWLFLILTLAWFFKVAVYPIPASSMSLFLQNAGFAFIPGRIVIVALLAFYILLIAGLWRGGHTRRTLSAQADLLAAGGVQTDDF